LYFSEEVKLQVFADIANAKPTAELRPRDLTNNIEQLDEDEMGMTYSEIDEYGKLR
jgi:NH3-dependent NAD+ synthetase